MSSATETSVEFSQREFLENAATYRNHKRIVDAASGYDNVDDAIASLREAWTALEQQAEVGAGFTPDRALGFGSDNATVIAESLMGKRTTVGAIRQAFAKLGKRD